jgi:hypothetical protein
MLCTSVVPPIRRQTCFRLRLSRERMRHRVRAFTRSASAPCSPLELTGVGRSAHFVGSSEQRRRHNKAERFGSVEIDSQIKFCGLLDREVSGLGPSENLREMLRVLAAHLGEARTVSSKPSIFHRFRLVNGGEAQLGCTFDD